MNQCHVGIRVTHRLTVDVLARHAEVEEEDLALLALVDASDAVVL